MKLLSIKVFIKFLFLLISLNFISILFFYSQQDNFSKNQKYFLSFDLMNLNKVLDDFNENKSFMNSNAFDQLYFSILELSNNQNFIKNISIVSPREKISNFNFNSVEITFSSEDKDLDATIFKFDEKLVNLFNLIITDELLSKHLVILSNENFYNLKKLYNENNHFYSIIFDSKKFIEYIESINFIEFQNENKINKTNSIFTLVYYLMVASVLSILIFLLYLAIIYQKEK